MYIYIYIYTYVLSAGGGTKQDTTKTFKPLARYGQFSKFHVCYCGLDSGNFKFETVQTNKQHICF